MLPLPTSSLSILVPAVDADIEMAQNPRAYLKY
jgi:hypothetical protein